MEKVATATRFFDQPRGVALVAATEFWERFSYYGFIGLVTLFMAADPATGGLGMDRGYTLKLFGVAVGMMFMAPSLGGWIADRLMGPYRAVVIGWLGLRAPTSCWPRQGPRPHTPPEWNSFSSIAGLP